MKKVLIYPYDKEFSDVISNSAILKQKFMFTIMSPMDSMLVNKSKKVNEQDDIYVFAANGSFEKELRRNDELWICSSNFEITNEHMNKMLDLACKHEKTVHLFGNYKKDFINEQSIKSEFVKIHSGFNMKINADTYNNDTPTIGVFGFGDKCNKFSIQLKLFHYLSKLGYKVSLIGTKEFSEVLGYHNFPTEVFFDGHSDSEQIELLKNYVNEILEEDNPDVLIIGIPLGIMQVNKYLVNEYGSIAYKVCCAIDFETTILSLFFESGYNGEFFSELEQVFQYRFGNNLGYLTLSKSKVNWMKMKQMKCDQDVYLSIDDDRVGKQINKYKRINNKFINAHSNHDIKIVTKSIINKLLINNRIEFI